MGFGKILWHEFLNHSQLGVLIEGIHVVFQESDEAVWILEVWHSGCSVSSSRLGLVGATTEITAVYLFLATILGTMPFDFTIEACIASYEFHFLCFRVLSSSASCGIDIGGDCSIDIHVISSLRGGTSSIIVASPIAIPS